MRWRVVDWERAADAFIRWQVGIRTTENRAVAGVNINIGLALVGSGRRRNVGRGWSETLVRRDKCWGGAVIRRTAVPRAQAGHSSQAAPS